MKKYTHILIDFDNTMMATEQYALPSLVARFNDLYAADITTPLTVATFKQLFHGQSREVLCTNLSRHYNITVDCASLYADREWIMMQHLHALPDGIAMAPGLVDTLTLLRDRHNITAALVSNNPVQRALCAMRSATNRQGDALAALLGTRLFEAGDRQKPLPDPYLRAMALLDVTAQQACAIEDSITGTRAAIAAGLDVYGFTGFADDKEAARQSLQQAGCRAVFDTWPALPALLAAP